MSENALKHLALVSPNEILPALLDRIYPALEVGVIESHRTMAAVGSLVSISTCLFSREHFPEGCKHLLPILQLTLPGLDINDTKKAILTLILYIKIGVTIPLRTVLETNGHDMETDLPEHFTKRLVLTESNMDEDQLQELNDTCKYHVSELRQWIDGYLDRVFQILENLPQQYATGNNGKSTEGTVLDLMTHASSIIFGQLSDDLYDHVVNRFVDYLSDNCIPAATDTIGLLTAAITRYNHRSFTKILDLVYENIKEEIENKAASVPSSTYSDTNPFGMNKMSDSKFHWYQACLMSLCSSNGLSIIQNKSKIFELIQLLVKNVHTKRGFIWTAKLVKTVLQSLRTYYLTETSLVGASIRDNNSKLAKY
jgi:proteasome activator subunit 4